MNLNTAAACHAAVPQVRDEGGQRPSVPPILHGMIYGCRLDVLRTFFAACESTKASTMNYRPPIVTLQIPAEKIDGHTVTFRPVRDGINSEVSGVIQVVERASGFSVNASYVVGQNPPQQSHVYWFDQSEIDAIARSLTKEKRRILIVDDDSDSTHLVKILLEKTGSYVVLEENDSAAAHQSARSFRPDVILMDIMMPKTDGAELAVQIEADPELHSPPIIFPTAMVTRPETNTGLRIEGHRSLDKPI